MYNILIFLSLLKSISSQEYCKFPDEPNVQNHSWEIYGPNGASCGELNGWSMNHGCYADGNPCATVCGPGKCFCIYACEPGYCMTQFNPAEDNIFDPSHGVLCQANGTILKLYSPNASLCVPCASVDPTDPGKGVVTLDGSPSPATFISSMSEEVPICGLMDPGVDDGLQLGSISSSLPELYAHMFPQWWYLPSIQSQIYIQVPGTSPEYACSTKKNPQLDSGNAGFYQVVYTAGGGIEKLSVGDEIHYLAFGQIAFFGDFGNNNMADLSMCWKHLGNSCIVDYGVRAYVCPIGQSPPSSNCSLECEIFLQVDDVSDSGKKVSFCKRITTCNLATCPDATQCLTSSDINGCNPVADITLGERIIYELFTIPEYMKLNYTYLNSISDSESQLQSSSIGIIVAVVLIVLIVVVIIGIWWKKNEKVVEDISL